MAKLNASDTRAMADVMYGIRDEQATAEHEEERRIFRAFQLYFANTPEGLEEGKWLNVANWEWIKAGRPTKIAASVPTRCAGRPSQRSRPSGNCALRTALR